jgi:hypothetical protein
VSATSRQLLRAVAVFVPFDVAGVHQPVETCCDALEIQIQALCEIASGALRVPRQKLDHACRRVVLVAARGRAASARASRGGAADRPSRSGYVTILDAKLPDLLL